MIYIILYVIQCLILTSSISVNYVHIFLKFNKIIILVLLLLLLLLSRSIELWNAVHIMSSIGLITQPTPLEKLYLEVKRLE